MDRVIVKNITKEFKIGRPNLPTFLQQIVCLFSPKKTDRIKILDNISFTVQAGEIVGLIGPNGAGKTTLLRILADIYPIYSGEKIINGKVIPLIDLGIGLNPRLTLKDNIFMVGAFFGLSSKQIKDKFNSIITLAELQNSLNQKAYQLSSGQKERIAFSIAIHCEPDILLLDEVFAVGDEEFRNKSSAKIKELAENGASVVFTSHELQLIEQYCHRVVWLENGRIVDQGGTSQIITRYRNC